MEQNKPKDDFIWIDVLLVPLVLPAWLFCIFIGVLMLPFPGWQLLSVWLFVVSGIGFYCRKVWAYWLMGLIALLWTIQISCFAAHANYDPNETGLASIFLSVYSLSACYLALIVVLCTLGILIARKSQIKQQIEPENPLTYPQS